MRFKKSRGRELAMKGMRPRYNTPMAQDVADQAAARLIPLHEEGHRAPGARIFHDPEREAASDAIAQAKIVDQLNAGQLLQVLLPLSPEPDVLSPSGHPFLREVGPRSKNIIKPNSAATYSGQDRMSDERPHGEAAKYYHTVFARDGIYAVEEALFQRAFRKL